MIHYALRINGDEVIKIESEVPSWLPFRQRLDRRWLRGMVAHALRNYFRRRLTCS